MRKIDKIKWPYRVDVRDGALEKITVYDIDGWCHCVGCMKSALFYDNYWKAYARSEKIKQKLASRDRDGS